MFYQVNNKSTVVLDMLSTKHSLFDMPGTKEIHKTYEFRLKNTYFSLQRLTTKSTQRPICIFRLVRKRLGMLKWLSTGFSLSSF